jgi:hypothetical protein
MGLEKTEARNDFAGGGQQQFNWPTDCEVVQLGSQWVRFGSQSKIDSWILSLAFGSLSSRELVAHGITGWSQRSEYEVGVRRSSPCEDVRPKAEERPPLETFTCQATWQDTGLCCSDLWSVVTKCKLFNKSSYQYKTHLSSLEASQYFVTKEIIITAKIWTK